MAATSPSMMTFKRLQILLYHSCIGHTVNHHSSAHAYWLGIERDGEHWILVFSDICYICCSA